MSLYSTCLKIKRISLLGGARNMIKVYKEKCEGCGNCIEACPFGVFEMVNGKVVVKHADRCRGCRACVFTCPNEAVEISEKQKQVYTATYGRT